MYDIIGDIHGHADELARLLERLDYKERAGVYAHPNRQAIFVGDFIDRGPKIRKVLNVVRPMIDAGTAKAVIGNHEFNAIAYHTPHPAKPGGYLREHSTKNKDQHQATVEQIAADELKGWIDWFRTLPFAIELPGLRVVHACWDPHGIQVIREKLNEHGGVTTAFMAEAVSKCTSLFRAVENVLKGPELELPYGSYLDKDGQERHHIRTRWFKAPAGRSYSDYALPVNAHAPDIPVPESVSLPVPAYGRDQPPVFFGHYWLHDEKPGRLAANVACVDYSVACSCKPCANHKLCAYQWNGERALKDANFVWVPTTGTEDCNA